MAYIHRKDEAHERLLLCWDRVPAGDEVPTNIVALDGDKVVPLQDQAERLIRGKRYAFIQLVAWNYDDEAYSTAMDEWGP
jgi:hypothetical protein